MLSNFKTAAGVFEQDKWLALIQGAVNLIISIVLVIALALGMTAFAEDEKVLKLSAGSAEVEVGEEKTLVEIPIKFEGDVKLTALQVKVDFSNEISFVEYKEGNVLKGITKPAVGLSPVVITFLEVTVTGVEAKT